MSNKEIEEEREFQKNQREIVSNWTTDFDLIVPKNQEIAVQHSGKTHFIKVKKGSRIQILLPGEKKSIIGDALEVLISGSLLIFIGYAFFKVLTYLKLIGWHFPPY